MSEPFLAEIRIVGFNFAPRGFAFCDGQLLPIQQNEALFSLLGTSFGGDGRIEFALPDLRGRVAIHQGDGYILGKAGGEERAVLESAHLPAHGHGLACHDGSGNRTGPEGNVPAAEATGATAIYGGGPSDAQMGSGMIASTGDGQPHENMQPFTVVQFIIALGGLFPTRN